MIYAVYVIAGIWGVMLLIGLGLVAYAALGRVWRWMDDLDRAKLVKRMQEEHAQKQAEAGAAFARAMLEYETWVKELPTFTGTRRRLV